MRVSLAWIGILLLTTVLVFFSVNAYLIYTETRAEDLEGRHASEHATEGRHASEHATEGRHASEHATEGFQGTPDNSDIRLTACPAESVSYVDNNGMSLCCKTSLVNGTCPSGQLACTLSEGSSSIPTCSAYLAAVLEEKGKERCPPSLPRYYEKGLVRGCTAGKRLPNGTGPATSTDPQCILYSLETDDQSKVDSCTNQRLLETTVCFQGAKMGEQKSIQPTGIPALISCSFTDPATRMPRMCYSDESLYRFANYIVSKGWWTKEWRQSWRGKLNWCSKLKKVYIDRTVSLADIENDPIA
jgi:hypothetical protein